jgi:hypothetical protein
MRHTHRSRRVVLRAVPRRDAAQRLRLAFGLLEGSLAVLQPRAAARPSSKDSDHP